MNSNSINNHLDDIFGDEITNGVEQKEHQNILRQYKEKFGHTIPMYLLPEEASLDGIYEKVKQCIESGKDNILELFGVEIDEDFLY